MADTSAAAVKAPAAGVMLPLPMLIGIVLGVALLVGGGSVAAIMLLRPSDAAPTEEEAGAGHGEPGEDEHVAGEAFLPLEDPFIVNLAPNEKYPYTYLKFAVALEILDETTAHHLEEKLPIIQATVNAHMNHVDYSVISTEDGQKQYAKEIMGALNERLAHEDEKTGEIHPPVTNVFFTTLVAQ